MKKKELRIAHLDPAVGLLEVSFFFLIMLQKYKNIFTLRH